MKENSTIWQKILRGLAWSWLLIALASMSFVVLIEISHISKTLPAYHQRVFFYIIEPANLLNLFVFALLPTVFLFWLSGIGNKKQDKDI